MSPGKESPCPGTRRFLYWPGNDCKIQLSLHNRQPKEVPGWYGDLYFPGFHSPPKICSAENICWPAPVRPLRSNLHFLQTSQCVNSLKHRQLPSQSEIFDTRGISVC